MSFHIVGPIEPDDVQFNETWRFKGWFVCGACRKAIVQKLEFDKERWGKCPDESAVREALIERVEQNHRCPKAIWFPGGHA